MGDALSGSEVLLKQGTDRLTTLATHCRDGMVLFSEDMHVLMINAQALRYLDLSGDPDRWIGRSLRDITRDLLGDAPEAVSKMLSGLRRSQGEDPGPGEGEYHVGSRTIHWLNLPLPREQRPLSRLLIMRDVTEARILKTLRQDLTHTMVCGLRDPLAGLATSLRSLDQGSSGCLPRDQRAILEQSIGCVDEMLSTISRFVDISELEGGRMPLSPSAFSFPELIDGVLAQEQALVEQKQLAVERRIAGSIPLTWGDRSLIQRVLHNLVSNALRFTPSGGMIYVEAGPAARDTDRIRVSVGDTGFGIPDEIRDHLFRKFAIGPQEDVGIGLGLAFCRMVLEAHGERIWLSRSSSLGTTITFTLPLLSESLRSVYPIH